MTPPISLQKVFARCRVKKVVFQPLLVEGALAIDDDGFVVFVNCDKNFKGSYQMGFDVAGQEGRFLPGRVRFSLAHELVHTFFYDTQKQPYASRLNATHPKEIDSLESACNFGASHLLIPTRSLKSDTYKHDVLTVDGITALAERYQVSIECLINRLEYLDDWTPKRGLVALVRQAADGYRIKATSKSVAIREVFENISVDAEFGENFGEVLSEATKQRLNGTFGFDLTYPRAARLGVAKCRMECRQVANAPQAFVLTLSVDDLTEAPTKHRPPNDADQLIANLREAIEQRWVPARTAQHLD
jgi:hypothetical protein